MEQPNSFGEWLRRRRRALDWTQEELAKQAGCAAGTIRKIEADELRPSKQLAEILAQRLDVPPKDREDFVRFARGVLPGVSPTLPFVEETVGACASSPRRPTNPQSPRATDEFHWARTRDRRTSSVCSHNRDW